MAVGLLLLANSIAFTYICCVCVCVCVRYVVVYYNVRGEQHGN